MTTDPERRRPFLFASFATPRYANHAARLVKSLDVMVLPHLVEVQVPSSSWERNCAAKARFLMRIMDVLGVSRPGDYQDRFEYLVWVDADAEILPTFSERKLLERLHEDGPRALGVCLNDPDGKVNSRLLSGFFAVSINPAARAFLGQWAKACEERPAALDQDVLLEVAMRELEPLSHVARLGLEYVHIPDLMVGKAHAPEVLHHQASRRFKDEGPELAELRAQAYLP